MNSFRFFASAGVGLACLGIHHGWAATINLPASPALPAGTSTTRGFVVRTAQAPAGAVVANNLVRAVSQLNGTLRDPGGLWFRRSPHPGPWLAAPLRSIPSISSSTALRSIWWTPITTCS